jgi:SAM-dependent methyltransferase
MRDLTRFETGSFDFVLCSFNGLDCIDHGERLAVLSEFRRVCDPSGAVCFSSHNLGAVSDLFRPREEASPGLAGHARQVARQALLRAVNKPPGRLVSSGHAMVRDGSLNFWLNQYYVTAGEQLAQLKAVGFSSVDVYGLDGKLVPGDALDEAGDAWLYYLAR